MKALTTLLLLGALLSAGPPQAMAEPPGAQLIKPGAFDRLELGGAAKVRYRQGDRDEVIVEGDEASQRLLELELHGSRLTVRTQRNWWPWGRSRVNLLITSRELRELQISGAADFIAAEPVKVDALQVRISGSGLARFDQLQARQLRFSVSGAGDGQFSGHVDELSVRIAGKGEVKAEQLAAERAQVNISGLGKARLWAVKDLTVKTSGVGHVDYWGSPEVHRETSGVSTINALGAKPAPGPAL